ncbi:MAG TPA: DUF5668 domain-containing protein, partial [Chryseosolibacter sp.]
MEPYNQNTQQKPAPLSEPNRSGRVMGGAFIVILGVIFLLRQAGVEIPYLKFSWETILIAVGLYLGFRHSFKGFGWLIPIIIGFVFLTKDYYPELQIHRYIWPVAIIAVGLFMILKKNRTGKEQSWRSWDGNLNETTGDDYLDSTVIFGGVKKNIISKNFRGGEA